MSSLRDYLAIRIYGLETVAEAYAEADAILAEYYVISRKPLPRSDKPVCPACGTWQCSECSFKRVGANRFVEQDCRCGSRTGVFLDTRHSDYKYQDHLDSLESYSTNGQAVII